MEEVEQRKEQLPRTPGAADAILYGLGAIKGLGQAAIDAILEVRAAGGEFRDLFDFCQRIDLRRVNRRVLESLIKAGALDSLGTHRAALTASLSLALATAEQVERARAAQQNDLFGMAAPDSAMAPAASYVDVPPWSEELRLEGEKETLGLYLTGHPIARYEQELKRFIDNTLAELKPSEDKTVVVAGLVVGMRTMQTRRGDRMAFVTLDDRTGRLELAVFSDLFERYRELLNKDALLVVEGQVSVDEYSGGFKMSAERLYNIDQARGSFASRVEIDLEPAFAGSAFIAELKQILKPATPGGCAVALNYSNGEAQVELVLGPEWKVTPTSELLDRLTGLAGAGRVRLIYPDIRRTPAAADTTGRAGRRNNPRAGMAVSLA